MVRYNRLIDTLLGLTAYSLQNHLKTIIKDLGQIEIDELHIGYVIPAGAKGEKDQIGIVQPTQDSRSTESTFPGMRPRAIAAQFLDTDVVASFESRPPTAELSLPVHGQPGLHEPLVTSSHDGARPHART